MKEGTSFSNLLTLMKDQGYNKDVSISIGVVESLSPLTVKLNGFIIEEEDLSKMNAFETSGAAAGDQVLVLVDNNDFYLLDKVV